MLPAVHQHPLRPRVGQGPDRRPHPRDLPADRPLAARGHRLQGARREHHRARLRRAPGRRRHPHRGDHRRVRRAGRRRRAPARRRARSTGEPLTGSVAAVSVGIIDGVPRLDLPYEEDVRAETDMNVVMTGDGAFVEVQGTAEGAAVRPRRARRAAGPGREGLRRPDPAPAGGARRAMSRVFLASRNAKKLAEMRRILAEHAARHRGARARRRDGVRRAGRGPADLRGQRAAQGARRPGRDRAAVARRRQRALRRRAQRHARGALGALVRRRPKDDDAQQPAAARPARRRARRAPRRRTSRCAVAFVPPGGGERASTSSRAGCPAGSSARCAGSGGFGYDVLFVRRRATTAR